MHLIAEFGGQIHQIVWSVIALRSGLTISRTAYRASAASTAYDAESINWTMVLIFTIDLLVSL